MPKLRPYVANLLLVSISTALALFGVEAILRWMKAPDATTVVELRQRAAAKEGRDFDPRSTLEVLEVYRATGVQAFPPVKPFNFLTRTLEVDGQEVLPLAGVANVLTVFNANETGERFVYESDEYGFHNPPGLHRVGEVDIAAIGDSFTQGVAVRSGQGIVEQIRGARPRTLNLGMGASGPLVELAILREYAQPLRPATVLWLYYEANDLREVLAEARHPVLSKTLTGDHEPVLRRLAGPLDEALIDFAEAMIVEHKASLATAPTTLPRRRRFPFEETKRRLSGLLTGPTEESTREAKRLERGFDLFRRALLQARTWTASWGGRLVVVYLPEYARFSRRWPVQPPSTYRENVLAFLEAEDIPVIDLLPIFRAHPDPPSLFPFSLPGHYDAEGCRLAAEAILASLGRDADQNQEPARSKAADQTDGSNS